MKKKKTLGCENTSPLGGSGGGSLLEVDLSPIITLVVAYWWSFFSFAEFTFSCLLKCLQRVSSVLPLGYGKVSGFPAKKFGETSVRGAERQRGPGPGSGLGGL